MHYRHFILRTSGSNSCDVRYGCVALPEFEIGFLGREADAALMVWGYKKRGPSYRRMKQFIKVVPCIHPFAKDSKTPDIFLLENYEVIANWVRDKADITCHSAYCLFGLMVGGRMPQNRWKSLIKI
jgi:hypothetical protein